MLQAVPLDIGNAAPPPAALSTHPKTAPPTRISALEIKVGKPNDLATAERPPLAPAPLVLPTRKTAHRRNLLPQRRRHLAHPQNPPRRRPHGPRRPQTHGRNPPRRRKRRKNQDSPRRPPRRRKRSASRAKESLVGQSERNSSCRNADFRKDAGQRFTLTRQMNFSLVVLPSLLCLVPLIVTAMAWQLERRAHPALSKLRLASFRAGLLLSILGLLVTVSCYMDPYPLVHAPDGSLSIAWFDRAWTVAFAALSISMILALFGRGWSRILLAVSGVLSLVLAYGSILQNGV